MFVQFANEKHVVRRFDALVRKVVDEFQNSLVDRTLVHFDLLLKLLFREGRRGALLGLVENVVVNVPIMRLLSQLSLFLQLNPDL